MMAPSPTPVRPTRPVPTVLARRVPTPLARLVPAPLATDANGAPIVDVRGPRFGAALTTVVLATAVIVQGSAGLALLTWQWAAFALVAIAGLAWSPYGRVFRALKRRLDLGPPPATEPEAGPRFAQACGLMVTTVALGLHLVGAATAGWIAAAVVLALSALLAITGLCVGCEVFVIAGRLRARFGPGGTGDGAARDERGRRGRDVEVPREKLAAVGLDLDGADVGALLFTSGTCSSCGQVKALLDELAPEFAAPDLTASGRQLRWAEVDAATHLDLTQTLRVLRVPTLVVIDARGQVVARTSGVPRREALRTMLDDALAVPAG